jgi:hypothetical protein
MTPEGWLEELAHQEAGHDMAVAVAEQKHKRSRTPDLDQNAGKPVYGMPGARFTPGRGFG